ncbi:unnamed protein product [Camellia sinensis]
MCRSETKLKTENREENAHQLEKIQKTCYAIPHHPGTENRTLGRPASMKVSCSLTLEIERTTLQEVPNKKLHMNNPGRLKLSIPKGVSHHIHMNQLAISTFFWSNCLIVRIHGIPMVYKTSEVSFGRRLE